MPAADVGETAGSDKPHSQPEAAKLDKPEESPGTQPADEPSASTSAEKPQTSSATPPAGEASASAADQLTRTDAGATASSGTLGQAGGSLSSTAQPARQLPPLHRLHLLPFTETDAKLGSKNRIDAIALELRKRRSAKEIMKRGDVLTQDGLIFSIIRCEPPEGPLGPDTDYFLDGSPLVSFRKIQFSAWGPDKIPQEALFKKCIVPIFQGEYSAFGAKDCKRVQLFHTNHTIQVGDLYVTVEATDPEGCMGAVSTVTEIFAVWDSTPELERVHIVPFQDTLPRAYQFDVFTDYLRPYLNQNMNRKYQPNDLFTFQGVQFKVVCCDPSQAPGRIGKGTTIFCEGVLHPSLRNLLPPELLLQVAQLPPGLQMLLLNTERSTRELEDMLSHNRGLFDDTLEEIEKFEWPPADSTRNGVQQSQCMVCLCDFADGEVCRRLPCCHVFHQGCVDEWLRRYTDCPICKANVDRAIRQY
eukprot:gnl/TRDRNA2_/TRDRNA2_183642_c0_seq1.p1 gnl/TRDRNA2_/TRDRNA2_183642_c0~~gnl/TRDRNA2_/TRDRNA2_183642_c0_seq1.p1  ORF type:complete len:508 (+),score=87.49 gnl/TRDRNA2_/TRDRNA2_183642_c0_seq1:109-1524(+)